MAERSSWIDQTHSRRVTESTLWPVVGLVIGAMATAAARGLQIPDNLSIIGYDDIPGINRLLFPLTTSATLSTESPVQQPISSVLMLILVNGVAGGFRGPAGTKQMEEACRPDCVPDFERQQEGHWVHLMAYATKIISVPQGMPVRTEIIS